MTVLFRLLAVPTGAIAGLVLLMSLAGRPLSAATPLWLSLAAALGVLALLLAARHAARTRRRPGLACALVLLSWLLFAATMLVNGLARQAVWQ